MTDSLKARLGRALRETRQARNVGGAELARRLGKQPAQIYRWERGDAAAGIDQVYLYLEAVGASFAEFGEVIGVTKRSPVSQRLKEIAAELESLGR